MYFKSPLINCLKALTSFHAGYMGLLRAWIFHHHEEKFLHTADVLQVLCVLPVSDACLVRLLHMVCMPDQRMASESSQASQYQIRATYMHCELPVYELRDTCEGLPQDARRRANISKATFMLWLPFNTCNAFLRALGWSWLLILVESLDSKQNTHTINELYQCNSSILSLNLTPCLTSLCLQLAYKVLLVYNNARH